MLDGGWPEDNDNVIVREWTGLADAKSTISMLFNEGAVGLDVLVEKSGDPWSTGSGTGDSFFVVCHLWMSANAEAHRSKTMLSRTNLPNIINVFHAAW